jgi:diguanylate cyclase (GGDEF)-like protein
MTFTALGLIGIVWVAMFMSFAIFMRRTIIAPLKEVAYRALRLAEGHLDERMEYRSRNEIGRVVEAFNHMADELQASYEELQLDKEELEAQQAELIEKNSLLERVSITDALTGLYNRGYMINRLAGDLSYSQRYGQPLSCLMMDLDFFKAINDTYGHQAGDLVLRQLAQIINMNLRKSDVAVRYGGEEFFVICPNTEGNGAVMLGERIRRAVQEHDFDIGDGNVIRMTISIGVAYIAPHDIKDIVQAERDIITRADSALYIAKGDGRNNVKLFAK